jgi:membrane-bound lytic murein transglycosylase D
MTSQKVFLCFVLVIAAAPLKAQENFPQPVELRPDIDFWVDIFTLYTTDQGVLHDTRNLAVVYEHIDFESDLDRRARQRLISGQRDQVRAVLGSLATGKRDNLGEDEARVLALWPDDVSNQTLATAAKQIRYQQGLRDRFREGLMRAGRWRDYINDAFRALGVPIDLAALPHVESSYNPNARSNVGASGIWQFTRSTGRRFMRIDHVIDERNDPFAATLAAGKLLAYNYSIAGNWPMAITAYNHGLAGVRRAMRKYGDTAYVDILRKYDGRTFGFASRNFYVAFLAARQVDQNAEQYFSGLIVDQPTSFSNTELKAFISVTDLSKALGVSSRQISTYNLSLQATVMTGSKHLPKGFHVRLPAELLDGSIDDLIALVPESTWQNEQLPDKFHTVRRGDTLSEIADYYRTRVSTLVALNNLSSSNRIRIGQQIRLPAAGPAPVQVAVAPPPLPEVIAASVETTTDEGEDIGAFTSSVLAGDFAAALLGTLQTVLLSDPNDYSVASDNTIEVHPLETLGHYADWLGIRTQRLRDINGLAFRTPVEVGKRIRLDLGTIDAKTFEGRRVDFHRGQQDAFFREHVITGVKEHVIVSGESIWILSLRKYDVPVWLFRQYNPGLNARNVQPGTIVQFPVMTSPE